MVDALVVVEPRAAALAPFPAGSTDLLQPLERGLMRAARARGAGRGARLSSSRGPGSGTERLTIRLHP